MAMKNKNKKEKAYFVIPWTQKYKTPVTKTLLRRLSFVILGLLMILTIGLGSGTLPFAVGTVRCLGLPIQTSDFMASYTYYLPGDDNYKPGLFSSYKYCTEQQAKAAGYRSSVVSEDAKQDALEAQQNRAEAERFSTSKVNYQVYIPVLEGFSVDELRLSEIKGNQHTFMRIKKNGTVIGQIRELRSDDSYNICTKEEDPKKAYCTTIGHDSEGREIKRYFRKGINDWKSYYVGVTINGTGIILSTDNDNEAVELLSALQVYKEGLVE